LDSIIETPGQSRYADRDVKLVVCRCLAVGFLVGMLVCGRFPFRSAGQGWCDGFAEEEAGGADRG
ncbi:hypothetical protein ACFUVU_33310, partial [Streptomyces griseoincarnatus]